MAGGMGRLLVGCHWFEFHADTSDRYGENRSALSLCVSSIGRQSTYKFIDILQCVIGCFVYWLLILSLLHFICFGIAGAFFSCHWLFGRVARCYFIFHSVSL